MTRAAQVTPAVSAIRKARADTGSSPEPAAMTFLIYEDNVGGYQSSDYPPPADLPARRHRITVTLRDRLDAERWLDEGGSFSSEAVTG
jgi:hypothetical protein